MILMFVIQANNSIEATGGTEAKCLAVFLTEGPSPLEVCTNAFLATICRLTPAEESRRNSREKNFFRERQVSAGVSPPRPHSWRLPVYLPQVRAAVFQRPFH